MKHPGCELGLHPAFLFLTPTLFCSQLQKQIVYGIIKIKVFLVIIFGR